MNNKSAVSKPFIFILSGFCVLGIWYLAAEIISAPLVLPSPKETFSSLVNNIFLPSFWWHVGFTALRSISAFFISVIIGTVLGILCGVSPFFSNLIAFPLAMIRTTPVVSFILLAIFWFGSSIVPVFVAVLMSLPIMVSAVETGILHTDSKLLDCSKSYGFSKVKQIFYIYIPSCIPSFLTGSISAFGLSWKVVVAGEVICLPRRGVGTLLQTAKVHVETSQVFAITLVVIFICFILETVFKASLKKLLNTGRYS